MRQQPVLHHFHCLLLLSIGISLLSLSCEGTHSGIIDTLGIPPQITGATLNPSAVNSDTINIAPERKPEDILPYSVNVTARIVHPLGQDHIIEPRVTFGRSIRTPDVSVTNLRDDGIFPDLSAGDSLFTGQLQFSLMRSEIGSFYAEASAVDAEGYISNTIRVPFTLLRLNQPPALSNLQAPDTVFLSLQSTFLVTVQATDPDGLSDILSVTRTTPSNKVFPLNDSGINGDVAVGDGFFTETVLLYDDQTPPPPVGSYVFIFKAADRSNATSQVINKTIVVAP